MWWLVLPSAVWYLACPVALWGGLAIRTRQWGVLVLAEEELCVGAVFHKQLGLEVGGLGWFAAWVIGAISRKMVLPTALPNGQNH